MAPPRVPIFQQRIVMSKTILTLTERGKAQGLVSFIQIIENEVGESNLTLKLKSYDYQFFIFEEKMSISEIKDAAREIVNHQYFTKLHRNEIDIDVFLEIEESRKIFKKILKKYF